jgi:hypothetical protein
VIEFPEFLGCVDSVRRVVVGAVSKPSARAWQASTSSLLGRFLSRLAAQGAGQVFLSKIDGRSR